MKGVIFYILIVAAFFSFPALWNSDFAQKRLNPQKYWQSKIDKSEEAVEFYRGQIFWCRLEMTKLVKNKNIEIQQRILEGLSGPDAVADYLAQIDVTREICDNFENILKIENDELSEAKDSHKESQQH